MVSFESVRHPGLYLRHFDFVLKLNTPTSPYDVYYDDASFIVHQNPDDSYQFTASNFDTCQIRWDGEKFVVQEATDHTTLFVLSELPLLGSYL